jgi:hypothetical protein
MKWISSLLLGLVAALAFPLSAHAATQIILGKWVDGRADPGIPAAAGLVSIHVGDSGSLQAKRGSAFEAVPGMFFGSNSAPAANFWHLRVKGPPAENVTYGPRDTAVTTLSNTLTAGAYTAASPARVDTVMRAGDIFEVTQTVLYVAPNLSYRVVWDIRNLSATQTIPFIFGTSADLFIDSDAGEGVFIDGANRFIGGRNKFTTKVGGVAQVTSSQLPGEAAPLAVAPWASWEEGDPFPIVRRLSTQDTFLNTINPVFMDNAVGVSWDDRATAGLAAGQTARYEVIWQLVRPPGATLPAAPPPAAALSAPGEPESPPAPPNELPQTAATKDAGALAAGGGGATSHDTAAPVLSALRVAPAAAGGAPRIVFRLSERADVVLRIVRRAKGRQVTVRRLTRAGLRAGTRAIAPGLGSGAKRLKPGRYVVFVQAVDSAGNRGARRSAAFRITR